MSKVHFSVATAEERQAVNNQRTGFSNSSNLSPLEAYLGLKSLFGEPSREDIDEDKVQWIFFLKVDRARLKFTTTSAPLGASASTNWITIGNVPND